VFLISIENLSDGFAFVWSQPGYVNQCLHALDIHCGDDSTCVSMSRQNHRSLRTGYCTLHGAYVIRERTQWDGSRDYPQPFAFKAENYVFPT